MGYMGDSHLWREKLWLLPKLGAREVANCLAPEEQSYLWDSRCQAKRCWTARSAGDERAGPSPVLPPSPGRGSEAVLQEFERLASTPEQERLGCDSSHWALLLPQAQPKGCGISGVGLAVLEEEGRGRRLDVAFAI